MIFVVQILQWCWCVCVCWAPPMSSFVCLLVIISFRMKNSFTSNVNDTCDLVHLLKTRKIYLTQTNHHAVVIVLANYCQTPYFIWRLMDAIQFARAITASSWHFFPYILFMSLTSRAPTSQTHTHFLMNVFRTFVLCIYPVAILLFHIVPCRSIIRLSSNSFTEFYARWCVCVSVCLCMYESQQIASPFNASNIHWNSHYFHIWRQFVPILSSCSFTLSLTQRVDGVSFCIDLHATESNANAFRNCLKAYI